VKFAGFKNEFTLKKENGVSFALPVARSPAAPGFPIPRRCSTEPGAAPIYLMTTATKKPIERRTANIAHRTTPEIKKMLEELARRGYRTTARENERLIIEAHQAL